MKLAYFGGDMFIGCMEMLAESGHEILALYTNAVKADEYDYTQKACALAKKHGAAISTGKATNQDLSALAKQGCEMVLAAGYPYRVPDWRQAGMQYGVNIHPSLLPIGAGPMPLPQVLIKGLSQTGVTLHKIEPSWDSGDIILQQAMPLHGQENIENLLLATQQLSVNLLERFMRNPQSHWDNAQPQDKNAGEYWPMPKPEDFAINFDLPGQIVCRYLRAHRFVGNDGTVEFMTGITFNAQTHDLPPGTVLSEKDGMHLMAVPDGLVSFNVTRKKLD